MHSICMRSIGIMYKISLDMDRSCTVRAPFDNIRENERVLVVTTGDVLRHMEIRSEGLVSHAIRTSPLIPLDRQAG
jgi:hypothetical protein